MNTRLAKRIIKAYDFNNFDPLQALQGKDAHINILDAALRAIELNSEKMILRHDMLLKGYSPEYINDFLHSIKCISGYFRGKPSRVKVYNAKNNDYIEIYLD